MSENIKSGQGWVLWYSVPEHDEDERYRLETKCRFCEGTKEDFSLYASNCAADYFHHHDGWDSSWPLEFVLYDSEDGPPRFRCGISLEAEPVFYPTALKEIV